MTSKCVICFVEHDRLHGDQPDLYCESCVTIKRDSVHVIHQITDLIYLSGMVAAAKFDGMRLCVHECAPQYEGPSIHIPILSKRPNSPSDRSGAIINLVELNKAVDVIEQHVQSGKKLLVHCMGGVERSPLTIAWYFVRSGMFTSLDEAYVFLKSKRNVVSDRQFWLP